MNSREDEEFREECLLGEINRLDGGCVNSPQNQRRDHATYRKSLFAVLCSEYSHVLEVLLGDAEPGGLVVPPLVVVVHGGQAGVAEGSAVIEEHSSVSILLILG